MRVMLRGWEATYTVAEGWDCNDGLTRNYLRQYLTPEAPSEDAALALVEAEYGDGCTLVDEAPTPSAPVEMAVHDDQDEG